MSLSKCTNAELAAEIKRRKSVLCKLAYRRRRGAGTHAESIGPAGRAIITAMSDAGRPMRVLEVAGAVDRPYCNVVRVLHRLASKGYAERVDMGRVNGRHRWGFVSLSAGVAKAAARDTT